MLILFMATDYRLLNPYLQSQHAPAKLSLVLAQSGVYELPNILSQMRLDNLYVIQRDLEVSGLLTRYVNDKRLKIIDYPEFVTLSTQVSPCITVQ